MKILYLSAPAGARKTQAIIELASQSACEGQKTLIIQPTIALVEDTEDRLRQHDPSALALSIHSGKVNGSVEAISKHLASTHSDGEVFLICQESFDQLQSFPRREEWNVIFDEIPKLDIRHEHNIPKSHRIVTDCLGIEGNIGEYSCLKAHATLKQMALNRAGDEVWRHLQSLARCLCSDDWDNYVLTKSYKKLLAGGNERFVAYSVRRPSSLSGFKSVRIASALFEHSLLYHAWKAKGVEFVEDQDLRGRLAFSEHQNGQLLTIKYALRGDWTKSRRNKPNVEEAVIKAFRAELGDEPFLWQQNKDREGRVPFGGMGKAELVPYVPHGLNKYIDYNNVTILSAFHLKPDHRAFHKRMWSLTDAQVTAATHFMGVYQAIMRCSLRDPENTYRKSILLPNGDTAELLSRVFLGSQLSWLAVDLTLTEAPMKRGRPQEYENSAARVRAWRQRKKAQSQVSDTIQPLVPRV